MTLMLARFDLKDGTEFREKRYINGNESQDPSEKYARIINGLRTR